MVAFKGLMVPAGINVSDTLNAQKKKCLQTAVLLPIIFFIVHNTQHLLCMHALPQVTPGRSSAVETLSCPE